VIENLRGGQGVLGIQGSRSQVACVGLIAGCDHPLPSGKEVDEAFFIKRLLVFKWQFVALAGKG